MHYLKLFALSVALSVAIICGYVLFTKFYKLDYSTFIPTRRYVLEDFKGKNIRIYEVFHMPAPYLANNIVIPIEAGRALHRSLNISMPTLMIGDDTGDNISEKNEEYAELTVLYWMWKNVRADYVGLMHYRRSFEIKKNTFFCQDYLCKLGLNQKNLDKLLDEYDIVLPKKSYVSPSVYQHYVDNHLKEDIDMALDYIRVHYPEMAKDIEPALMTPKGYFTNMFIMKKEIMDEYATWLFEILFALEDKLDYSLVHTKTLGIDAREEIEFQRRTAGFLAERLSNIWMLHNKDKYKIGELNIIFR